MTHDDHLGGSCAWNQRPICCFCWGIHFQMREICCFFKWKLRGSNPRLLPKKTLPMLVGGLNPSEKYDRQIGSFPQVGMKIKKYLKPPPSYEMMSAVMYQRLFSTISSESSLDWSADWSRPCRKCRGTILFCFYVLGSVWGDLRILLGLARKWKVGRSEYLKIQLILLRQVVEAIPGYTGT